jgi:hypothetical protein
MASSMFYLTLLFCGVAPAVTELMRAEQRDSNVELHLGAQGEFRTLKKATAKKHPTADNDDYKADFDELDKETRGLKHAKKTFGEKLHVGDLLKMQSQANAKAKAKAIAVENDMCDLDFPLGKENKDECKGADKRILDRTQCHESARQNKGDDKQAFLLDSNWFNVHPEGCFAEACDAAKVNATEHPDANFTGYGGLCYYFNPTGFPPHGTITGTPVCERAKFLNATQKDINVGGCHEGYERIYNEFTCHKVGGCLSDPDADEFRVGIKNFSQHFDFPRGCFIADDGEVYYNPIKDPTGAPIPIHADAVVYGMPLCAVKGKAGNEVITSTSEEKEETSVEGETSE